jgi:hypothetical protein
MMAEGKVAVHQCIATQLEPPDLTFCSTSLFSSLALCCATSIQSFAPFDYEIDWSVTSYAARKRIASMIPLEARLGNDTSLFLVGRYSGA